MSMGEWLLKKWKGSCRIFKENKFTFEIFFKKLIFVLEHMLRKELWESGTSVILTTIYMCLCVYINKFLNNNKFLTTQAVFYMFHVMNDLKLLAMLAYKKIFLVQWHKEKTFKLLYFAI